MATKNHGILFTFILFYSNNSFFNIQNKEKFSFRKIWTQD